MNALEEDDILEVNLDEILYQLIHKFWLIILTGVVCAIPVFVFMEFINTPVYTSSTSILVNVNSTQLSDEYLALATSGEVLSQTLEKLQLNCDADELKSKVSASVQTNTRIMHISVSDQDPDMAKRIADTVREYTVSLIRTSRGIDSIRVLNEANLPKSPSGASVKRTVVFAAAAGVFVAACIIILMTLFRSTICTPEEVKRCVGLDTMGIIPKSEQNSISEELRTLRANLLFCGKDIKSIAIVSSTSGEGTTSIIWKLAFSLTGLKKRVLVINADMRRTSDSDFWQKVQGANSLFDYLSDRCSVEDCIVHTSDEYIYAIQAGKISDDPTQLLSSERLDNLMQKLGTTFAYILVDCPPLSDAIDGAIIAKACDASVIILESDKIKCRLLRNIKEQLEKANPRILGVVLNKFDVKKYKCYGNYFVKSDSQG